MTFVCGQSVTADDNKLQTLQVPRHCGVFHLRIYYQSWLWGFDLFSTRPEITGPNP